MSFQGWVIRISINGPPMGQPYQCAGLSQWLYLRRWRLYDHALSLFRVGPTTWGFTRLWGCALLAELFGCSIRSTYFAMSLTVWPSVFPKILYVRTKNGSAQPETDLLAGAVFDFRIATPEPVDRRSRPTTAPTFAPRHGCFSSGLPCADASAIRARFVVPLGDCK